MSEFKTRLSKIINFASRSRVECIDKIRSFASRISIHVIKLLIYPEDQSRTHWSEEIITWIRDVKNLGNSKSLIKNFTPGKIRGLIENESIANEFEIKQNIKTAISDHDKIPRNKVKVDEYDIDCLGYSLDYIYNQFEEYFDDKMSLSELKLRLEYSFAWSYDMSEEELNYRCNEWRNHQ